MGSESVVAANALARVLPSREPGTATVSPGMDRHRAGQQGVPCTVHSGAAPRHDSRRRGAPASTAGTPTHGRGQGQLPLRPRQAQAGAHLVLTGSHSRPAGPAPTGSGAETAGGLPTFPPLPARTVGEPPSPQPELVPRLRWHRISAAPVRQSPGPPRQVRYQPPWTLEVERGSSPKSESR